MSVLIVKKNRLNTTADEKVVGIEFLNASQRLDIRTILSYSLSVEKTVAV